MYGFTYAFQAEVLPDKVKPGDAFIIKVTGMETSHIPDALLKNKHFYFSRCGGGCFVAIGAVGIDTQPGVYTIHVKVGENKPNLELTVRQTDFPTISLTLPEGKVVPSPENLERAKREGEKLRSIWPVISEKLWQGSFSLPLNNDMSTAFGTKRIFNRKKTSVHKGIDVRGKKGEEVKASNRGRVVLAGELFFGGNTLILDHGQGIYTIYMHMSKFKAGPGDVVSKGDVIGLVGSSGRASGPHLHFGVKVLNINVNPVSIFKLQL